MAMLTVRSLPDEVHQALQVRAALHGISMEAEVRQILMAAVQPTERLRMGSALAMLGRELGLSDAEVSTLETRRDTAPAKPMELG